MIAAAIKQQLREAATQERPVEQIRVSNDALPGSIVGLPMSPGVNSVEVVVHPDDFSALLFEEGIQYDLLSRTTSVMGVPIFYDAKTPLDLVANAIYKLTDGSITFSVAQDGDVVVASFMLMDQLYAYHWTVRELEHPTHGSARAEAGIRELLSLPNRSDQ